MDSFSRLTELFRQFPGIGPRQAKRFVYFLLAREATFIRELARRVAALQDEIIECSSCHQFFPKRTAALCPLCADPNRSESELMVVAKDTDLDAMEKGGAYGGRYFVLGGTIPLLEAKTPDKPRVKELLSTVAKKVKNRGLKEIILALSANPEGEYTSNELRKAFVPILRGSSVKVSALGRGLSTGSELEYADKETLTNALKNRTV